MGIKTKQVESCLVCGTKDSDWSILRGDGITLKRCQYCRSVYLDQIPENVTDLYSINYFGLTPDAVGSNQGLRIGYEGSYEDTYLDAEFYWAFCFADFIASTQQIDNHKRSCLDIGAATGRLLNVFKYSDYETHGIEFSAPARIIAKERGHTVTGEAVETLKLTTKGFQVVTALEVIEHVEDLKSFFEGVKRVMAENSIFLGYFPSADERWFGANSNYHWLYNSFEHLVYPSEHGIKLLMTNVFGPDVFVATFLTKQREDVIPNTLVIALKTPASSNQPELVTELFRQLTYILHPDLEAGEAGLMELLVGWKSLIDSQSRDNQADLPFIIALLCAKFGVLSVPNFLMQCEFSPEILSDRQLLDLLAMAMHQGAIHYMKGLLSRIEDRPLIACLKSQYQHLVDEYDARHDQCTLDEVKRLFNDAKETQKILEESRDFFAQQAQRWESEAKKIQQQAQHWESEVKKIQQQAQHWESEVKQIQQQTQHWESEAKQAQNILAEIHESRSYRLMLKLKCLKNRPRLIFKNIGINVKALLPQEFKNNLKRQYLRYLEKYKFKVIKIENVKWSQELPLVSIVIPCFNYGHYIEEAINSVLAQTFVNYEIIVVDGGSTDERTIIKLKSLHNDKTVIFYREGRHLVGDNRNFGIERARGKYVCCLDADDILKPTYLEKALFTAESGNYDVVYPSVQCFGESSFTWHVNKVDFLSCAEGNNISTVALFKKDVWCAVGGYKDFGLKDEHVPEDWEFWVRVLGHGFRSKRLIEPLMLYRVHDKGLTASNEKSVEEQIEIIKRENIALFNSANLQKIEKKVRITYNIKNPFINLDERGNTRNSVLFALPFMTVGGADVILLQVAQELKDSGFELSFITTLPTNKNWGDSSRHYEKISEEVYHLHEFLEDKSDWENFVFYLIESKQIQVIFIVGCEFIYHLLPSIKKRYPAVRIIDQLFNEVGHIANNRLYACHIDYNVVANTLVLDELVETYHEDPTKVEVIIHGTDVFHEYNPLIYRDSVVEQTELFVGKFVVGFFGRFSPEKCPELFVDIANLLRSIPDLYFVMTGDGPEYQRVTEKIDLLGLTDRIYTPGIVADVKPFLYRADVVVIPSKIEGIPIILFEGMSMGKPVVASHVGGIPSIIDDGCSGFLCESGDPAEFAGKIQVLHSDRDLRVTIGKNARTYAENYLDVAQMKDKYRNVFMANMKKRGVENI